jgi:hypothetical protein
LRLVCGSILVWRRLCTRIGRRCRPLSYGSFVLRVRESWAEAMCVLRRRSMVCSAWTAGRRRWGISWRTTRLVTDAHMGRDSSIVAEFPQWGSWYSRVVLKPSPLWNSTFSVSVSREIFWVPRSLAFESARSQCKFRAML